MSRRLGSNAPGPAARHAHRGEIRRAAAGGAQLPEDVVERLAQLLDRSTAGRGCGQFDRASHRRQHSKIVRRVLIPVLECAGCTPAGWRRPRC